MYSARLLVIFSTIYWSLCLLVFSIIVLHFWFLLGGSGGYTRRPTIQQALLLFSWFAMVVCGVSTEISFQRSVAANKPEFNKLIYISWNMSLTAIFLAKGQLVSVFLKPYKQLSAFLRALVIFESAHIFIAFVLCIVLSMTGQGYIGLIGKYSICQSPLIATFTVSNLSTDAMRERLLLQITAGDMLTATVMLIGVLIIQRLRLNSRRRQAVALSIIFSIGGLSIAASVARIAVFFATPSIRNAKQGEDFGTAVVEESSGVVTIFGLYALEQACAVVACSIPSIRYLWRRVPGKGSLAETPMATSEDD